VWTLGVIYLNFYAKNLQNDKNDFHQGLIVIKVAYCSRQKVRKDGMWMDALLDPYELDL